MTGLALFEDGHHAANSLLAGSEVAFAGQSGTFNMGFFTQASGAYAAKRTDRRAASGTGNLAADISISHLTIVA
jgi:hypothetical protein